MVKVEVLPVQHQKIRTRTQRKILVLEKHHDHDPKKMIAKDHDQKIKDHVHVITIDHEEENVLVQEIIIDHHVDHDLGDHGVVKLVHDVDHIQEDDRHHEGNDHDLVGDI